MTFNNKKYTALAMGVAIVGFGLVQTRSAEGSGLPGDLLVAQSANVGEDSEKEDKRSPKIILEEAKVTVGRIHAQADDTGRKYRTARENKDVVKTLCLDDKLGQLNVTARSADDRLRGIELAVESGNTQRMTHDDAVLSALSNRANELSAEANQCIGAETGGLGEAELNVTVDPSLPTTPGTTMPASPTISAPPAASSPTI